MQALIDLLAGFIALLAAAALAQFGVDFDPSPKPEREVHRVSDCSHPQSATLIGAPAPVDC